MSIFLVVGRKKDCDYYAMLKTGFGIGGVFSRTLPHHAEIDSLVPDSIRSAEERWMAIALLEAMNGIGWASPNPSVGCVIVRNEKIIARGFTQSYGGLHAERSAFESLQSKYELHQFSDLHVYVTLEPCTHFGKQPPCVDLLLHPAVKKVWIGCEDPNPLVAGKGIALLRRSGKEVEVGILKNEVEAWHSPFLMSQKVKKPLWVAKWAENQDGLLADSEGNSKWITNADSRAYTHWLRQKYDAILVGAGTWIRDQPQLTVRDCAGPHRRNPIVLVHDPKNLLESLPSSKIFYVFKEQKIADLISVIEQKNFGFELQSVFCEGGARTLNELFRAQRIDLVHRFVGQKALGSSKHRIMEFHPESPGTIWTRAASTNFGNDLLQEWVKCS